MLLDKIILFVSNGGIYFRLLGRGMTSPDLTRDPEVTSGWSHYKEWATTERHLEETAGEEGRRTGREKECRKGMSVH